MALGRFIGVAVPICGAKVALAPIKTAGLTFTYDVGRGAG